MEQDNPTRSLRDFLTVLFKRKNTILLVFFTVVATVTIGSFRLSPTYEATSSLLVKFGREYIYRPEVAEKVPDYRVILPNQEEIINTEIEILQSRDLIEKVITTLKVENIYPDLAKNPSHNVTVTPLEAAIQQFKKNFSAEGIKKSNVIEASFQHQDPRIAAKSVNLLVDFLKEKHLQVYSDPKSTFLDQQRSIYEQRLKGSQNHLEDFKQKYRVFSLEEQRTLLLKQRTDLDTALKTAQHQVKELQSKLSFLKNQMRTVSKDVPLFTETLRQRNIDDAKTQLLTLQLTKQKLLKKYNENHPLVGDVRKEINIVEDFIKKEEEDLKGTVRTGQNTVYQELELEMVKTEADLASQGAKSAALQGQISRLDIEIRTLDFREKELQNLKRDISENESNYKTYLEKVEEARISDDLNRQKMTNISVIQAATVPAKPVKPKKRLNILLGMIFGAVSGRGLAFFNEYTAQGLLTPESTERRLGLPVLATRPYKGQDLELDMDGDMEGESRLYQSIEALLPDTPNKIIQFIGSREGEGTSTVIREFARVSAIKFGKSVLLLDADRNHPGQRLFFNIKPDVGWEDVIPDDGSIDKALYQIGETRLFISPASQHSATTPQMIDSLQMDTFLKELRQRFDLILIDSPPATTSSEGLSVSPKVDGIILVLEAEKTRWPVVENVKERITKSGGKILGIVLNKRRFYIPEFIYRLL